MDTLRIIALSCICVAAAAQADAAEKVWSLAGFQAPESVLFDPERDTFYVSNIAGPINEKDGNGYISKVSSDGTMLKSEWVSGLDAPKGLAQMDGTLYVADVGRLVSIDIDSGEINGTWTVDGAQLLNDVAVDNSGRVFVSDTLADRIYVLEGDAISVFAEGAELLHPNGLHVEGGTLTVAGWGENIKDDFTTEKPGRLLTLDLSSKAISPAGSGLPVGNLDGLEPDGSGGWLTTDWMAGALYRINPQGGATQLLDLNQGSADLEFIASEKLVIIPMMMDGEIVAYRID